MRVKRFTSFSLVGVVVCGLFSACVPVQRPQTAAAPPPPAGPTIPSMYVVKPSPTNFIYEPPQSSNKSASKVAIAILRTRLEKEEGGQSVQSQILTKPQDVAAEEITTNMRLGQLAQELRNLDAQERQLTLEQIILGGAGTIIDRRKAIQDEMAELTQKSVRLKFEEKVAGLQAEGDAEVSGRVKTMTDAFLDSAQRDLERLLIAKGFKTSGPFKDHEEMTFSEKKEATFEFPPTIKLVIGRAQPKVEYGITTTTGEVSASGEVSLILIEPLSGQKIWAKRLPMPKRTATYKVELSGTTLMDDRAQVTANVLSALYKDLMDTISKHVNPEEFAALSVQSAEPKNGRHRE